MKTVRTSHALILGLALQGAAWAEDGKPEYLPLAFGGFSEFGLLRSGQYDTDPFKDEWVDHFGSYVAQTVKVREDLAFDVGLGGVFEYQKREIVQSQWGGTQYKNFFVGPSVADLRYAAAARDGQGFGLQFGMFDYKYNPDALDLGEYLFRSGTYPGYVTSGGFWFVNDNSVPLQGLRAGYGAGNLKADLLLITETSMPALYDFSGAAVVGYTLGGWLELGAGLNFKHMIPVKPSRTSPRIPANAYFEKNGVTYTGNADVYVQSSGFYKAKGDTATAHGDAARAAAYYQRSAADSAAAENVKAWVAKPDSFGIALKYYTQQGLIGMARASIDFKKLFGGEGLMGPNDLRLYTEIALLGAKNYPLYYEKIGDRMPIMFGINLPTFRILDLLAVQGEYYHSPYLNSYVELVGTNSATPTHVFATDSVRSREDYGDLARHDDFSWSVQARKNIGGRAYISARAAHDHIRTVSIKTWTAPEPTQVLGRNKDWYWMLQFGFGI